MFKVFAINNTLNKQGRLQCLINQSINHLIYSTFFFLLLLFFASCQNNLTEPNSSTKNVEIINKDNPSKIPDVYVHSYVYKDMKPAKYANVKLLDENGFFLTQTSANGTGYYSMIICPYGYGFRTVKATYTGEVGSNHFNFVPGTWDYEVDVHVGYIPDKSENQ